MSLPRWANMTVTVISPGTRTVFGAEESSWAPEDVQRREIHGCWCWPANTEDLRDRGRDTTLTAQNVNLPPRDRETGETIVPPTTEDRLELPDGDTYEIFGSVEFNKSATGRLDYHSLFAERYENRG